MKRHSGTISLCFLFALACSGPEKPATIGEGPLPKPVTTGGMSVRDALAHRQTSREFDTRKLSPQMLSDLLWAAYGINREDGKRTAPSAFDARSIDVYVALTEGFFRYDAGENSLRKVRDGDGRPLTGGQDFALIAPATLVYVSDLSRYPKGQSEEERVKWSRFDTGFIGQNVYLFCAAEGLGCVVRAVDGDSLAVTLGLSPDQRVTLAQTVGYPKGK